MKRCSKCEEERPLDDFHRNSASKDGLDRRCKSCAAMYNRERYQRLIKTPKPTQGTKICTTCLVEKSLEEFHSIGSTRSGRRAKCIECVKTERRNNSPIYYCTDCGVEKPKGSLAGRCKPCGARRKRDNEQRRKETITPVKSKVCTTCQHDLPAAEFHRDPKSKDGLASQCKECARQYRRSYYEANPDYHIARAAARNRRLGPPDAETTEFMKLLRKDPCSYCGQWPKSGENNQIDHIVPVSQGGTNHWSNMAAACRPCNISKSDKPLLLWLAERAGCRNEDGTKYIAPRPLGRVDELGQMAAD